ncbi:MAG: hypothetical protein RL757_1153 [Bacteroidota bacterium]|jgi:putative oxidoreductase
MSFLKRLMNPNPISVDLILIARIVVGGFFIWHGRELFSGQAMNGFASYLEKLGFPQTLLMAYLRTGAELFGGIMLVLGLFTRLGAFLIMFTMLVAVFTAHLGRRRNAVYLRNFLFDHHVDGRGKIFARRLF